MIDRPDPSPIISTLAATDIMSDCPAIIGKIGKGGFTRQNCNDKKKSESEKLNGGQSDLKSDKLGNNRK